MLARHGIGEDTLRVAVSVCQLGRSARSNLGCFGVFRACLPMRLSDLSCGAQLQPVDGRVSSAHQIERISGWCTC